MAFIMDLAMHHKFLLHCTLQWKIVLEHNADIIATVDFQYWDKPIPRAEIIGSILMVYTELDLLKRNSGNNNQKITKMYKKLTILQLRLRPLK